MHTYIKKLQSKSENTRKQILAGSLILCMVLVGIVWVSSLGYRFGKKNTTEKQNVENPFSIFSKTIKDTFSNMKASAGSVSSSLKKEETKVESGKVIDLIPVENTN